MSTLTFQAFLEALPLEEALASMGQFTPEEVANRLKQLESQEVGLLPLEEKMRVLAMLLSSAGQTQLETMAQQAHRASLKHFGRAVTLYTPLYVSNYCINGCKYCGYGAEHKIKRRALTLQEIESEAACIVDTGLRHVLLLVGESDQHFGFEAIKEASDHLVGQFDSVALEGYAMTEQEYAVLSDLGVFGITLYQETYDRQRYEALHPYGPKADYQFRLEAPERIGRAGMRGMNIGLLMGLAPWQVDVLHLGLHGLYLSKYYPEMELSLSLPRLQSYEGSNFEALGIEAISDATYVQAMLALRLVLPHVAQNVSTRETADMRANLLPLGANKLSAGVSTEVGGRTQNDAGAGQFDIADDSSVAAVREMIYKAGYQPVLRDWMNFTR